jgi:hypothetical protein
MLLFAASAAMMMNKHWKVPGLAAQAIRTRAFEFWPGPASTTKT